MIGVIPKPDQTAIIEEFFQLFKTPWEFYRDGRAYDVVFATADEIPVMNVRLLIISGPGDKTSDLQNGIFISSRITGAILSSAGTKLPLFKDVAVFGGTSGEILSLADGQHVAGIRFQIGQTTVIRLGYDFFEETEHLLGSGQPIEWAPSPTLELHIRMLRDWILGSGIPLLEIPPAPMGHPFFACLTHDIDFIGIRRHKFDHTMWGFLGRATAGAFFRLLRGRASWSQLIKNWLATLSLPLIYLGWIRDFWLPFEWYLKVEDGLPSTYFVIPFKDRPGGRMSTRHPERRAAAYDITDIPDWSRTLISSGCEIGVHGIDAWQDTEKGREELDRIASVTGHRRIGVRMHWLLWDTDSPRHLEDAGYSYDSSSGYNDTVGYRSGTTQAFRPPGAINLLELPINIQDGALFFPKRLGLSEEQAWTRCATVFENAREFGGAITIIWHDRSPHPERFWGAFYVRLIQELKSQDATFGTASQIVDWFRKRRSVVFEVYKEDAESRNIGLLYEGEAITPPLRITINRPQTNKGHFLPTDTPGRVTISIPWSGDKRLKIDVRSGSPTNLPQAPSL